jgi:tetratricopeptide (TPR) repeat protein
MRTSILFAAFLSVVPAAALGMTGYGAGISIDPSMMKATGPGMEDFVAAIKLMQRGSFADAIPHLQQALQAQPGNADILNFLGFSSRMVGNYNDSLDFYQRALARNPDHKGAHEYLGELYLTIHQLGNARGQLAELERLCPSGCLERDALTKAIADYENIGTTPSAPAPSNAAEAPPPPRLTEATGAPTKLGPH